MLSVGSRLKAFETETSDHQHRGEELQTRSRLSSVVFELQEQGFTSDKTEGEALNTPNVMLLSIQRTLHRLHRAAMNLSPDEMP